MGAATLRRGPQVLLPRALPSVSGAEHQRALTDLKREMGLEVLAAKKAGGLTQEDVDAAVDKAREVSMNNLRTWQGESDEELKNLEAQIEEQQARIDEQQERIDALPDDADETAAPEPDSTPEAEAEPPAEHPTQGMNADDAIDHLIGLESVEEVEALKAAEVAGKNRKGVLAEVERHIAYLNEPD